MTNGYRKARVMMYDREAGIIEETEHGYRFHYDENYLKTGHPISVSLPMKPEPYESDTLFSFFEGLLPEGWYLDVVSSKLKIDKNDIFGMLLATCTDTAGAVSMVEVQ